MATRQMLILYRISGCFRATRKLFECNSLQWEILYQQQLRNCVSYNTKLPEVPYLTQYNGVQVPQIGFGTWKALGTECVEAVSSAITFGYRSIDTAYVYGNEVEVGKAIREKIESGSVKRSELFLTTKLWCIHHEPRCVEHACRLSLANLCLDYIDLYLMHWPFGFINKGDDVLYPRDCTRKLYMSTVDYLDTWNAMEKLLDKGLVKNIGVANFNSEQLTRLIINSNVKPVQNQIEVHPMFANTRLIEYCKEKCIVVTGHSPFAAVNHTEKTPKFLYDGKVLEIAKNHRRTPFQIVLKYLAEKGIIPIPKSVTQERIIENLEIFDFKLTPGDHKFLDKYHTGQRVIPFDKAAHSPYYPFNVPF